MGTPIPGSVGLTGKITPKFQEDTYAVIDPIYGIDGWRNVDSITERNEIPEDRRRIGMIVGVSGGTNYYKLKNNPSSSATTDTDWEEFTTSSNNQELWFSGTGLNSLQTLSATAIGDYSVAEGYQTTAIGENSHVEGYNNIASGWTSHVEGAGNIAYGWECHVEGEQNTTFKDYSHAEGYKTTTFGENAHSEGSNTIASGESSHAEGCQSTANGDYSHVEGVLNIANGESSHAEGYKSTAFGQSSHAEGGRQSKSEAGGLASGEASHAEGSMTTAAGLNSHAEGTLTLALNESNHSEGNSTSAIGSHSHSEGSSTTALGVVSHAEGQSTKAIGNCSHSQNYNTIAASFAETVIGYYNYTGTSATTDSWVETDQLFVVGNGDYNSGSLIYNNALTIYKNGNASFDGNITANGFFYGNGLGLTNIQTTAITGYEQYWYSGTGLNSLQTLSATATGDYAVAEGYETTASGDYSHSEGFASTSIGVYSHTSNYMTIASSQNETVFGRYNLTGSSPTNDSWVATDQLFVIGNGSSTERKNALTIYKNGNSILGDGTGNTIDNSSTNIVMCGCQDVSASGNNKTYVYNFNINNSITPSSSADTTGYVGDITWDDSYLYVKTNNGWGRTTLDFNF
jgi:hypothetical protein